jgi:hypothetical protein
LATKRSTWPGSGADNFDGAFLDSDTISFSLGGGQNASWTGFFFVANNSNLATTAGAHGTFTATKNSEVDENSSAVLSMPVIRTGEFAVGFIGTASLEFQQSVASGIFVEVTANPGALLTIDQPNAFLGSVQLGDPTSSGIGETIRLLGLQSADSYSFLNDILSLYSGNTVIDTLRMQNGLAGSSPVQPAMVRAHFRAGVGLRNPGSEDSLTSMGHRRHSAACPMQSTLGRLPCSRSQEAFGGHHCCPLPVRRTALRGGLERRQRMNCRISPDGRAHRAIHFDAPMTFIAIHDSVMSEQD